MKERYGVDSMPETAENLAREKGISREDQDAYALRSQQRTARAYAEGRLAPELLPVEVKAGSDIVRVEIDEHPRPGTTLEALARLKPILGPGTTITAGNASGINDGAGAVLLASEAAVTRHGLQPIVRDHRNGERRRRTAHDGPGPGARHPETDGARGHGACRL